MTRDSSGSLHFRAGGKVGSITVAGLRLNVLPRLSAPEFTALVRYALGGFVRPDHFKSFADLTWETGFEDALGQLLADETRNIFRTGLARRYVAHVESLNVLRGRPLWTRNFPWLEDKATKIVCRYHQLTYDNLDNRLLVAGLKAACRLARKRFVVEPLTNYFHWLRSLTSETVVGQEQFEAAAGGYNRLNEHYRCAHGLSRMFLFGLRPESFFEHGRQVVSGVVIDMAELFEKFVEQLLKDILGPSGFRIVPQSADHRALVDAEGVKYSSIRPDVEVWRGDRPCAVVDAKYKDYWSRGQDGEKPIKKITNEDLYQLFFLSAADETKTRTGGPAFGHHRHAPSRRRRKKRP
jgi:5-methylcytosine-specific restriction endonuclease McrBC regulatory subunit McrC